MLTPSRLARFRLPLAVQVLVGVTVGVLLGLAFGEQPYVAVIRQWLDLPYRPVAQFGNPQLGALGLLIVDLLRAFATPLIFFAILDAFVRTEISGRAGLRLLGVCVVNVAAAMAVGLCILHLLAPGLAWRDSLSDLAATTADGDGPQQLSVTLSPLEVLQGYVPKDLVSPFVSNSILSVVIVAILLGAAIRAVRRRAAAGDSPELAAGVTAVERFVTGGYQVFAQVLEWIVRLIPWAVLGAMAMVVGERGIDFFGPVAWFLGTVLLGLGIHALVYYPLSAWLVGGKSPGLYLGRGADAIGTGFSVNSSLATVPVTLRCLERMGVSPASARLSACVGTNFNNDGITLYEAMTVLFACQAIGHDLSLAQQVGLVLTSLMASIGVAGVPGSGLIVLPLVLKAVGLKDEAIADIYPIVAAVDPLLARVRSAVNVMGDMQVAILLDRWSGAGGASPPGERTPGESAAGGA
jgi:DAACS family dicarboxylate/amino acid:cation (Na+ or H+) symporter